MAEKKPIQTSRIREEELDTAIWRPKDNAPIDEVGVTQVLVFTLLGKEDYRVDEYGNDQEDGFPLLADAEDEHGDEVSAEDQEAAYAKSIQNGNVVKYYTRRGHDGKLFNPIGMYEENRHSKTKHVGIGEIWTFKEVNRTVFLHYLNFLKTINVAWLTTAQRELI